MRVWAFIILPAMMEPLLFFRPFKFQMRSIVSHLLHWSVDKLKGKSCRLVLILFNYEDRSYEVEVWARNFYVCQIT